MNFNKSVEYFVKWVDKESKTDALKMVFDWDKIKNVGHVHAYTCCGFNMILERAISCTKQEFESAKKMPPELLATLVLG